MRKANSRLITRPDSNPTMKRFAAAFILLFGLPSFGAEGLTPKSPAVLHSVDRAAAFLRQKGGEERRLGGRALVALALYKAGADPEREPIIQGTIAEIQKAIADDGTVTITDHIYTAGIFILLLAEIDPDLYRRELTALGRFLHTHQRKDGSWTYLTNGSADAYPTGDMSMTQYGAMGLWTLHQVGIDVPGEAVDRLARFLVLAQNPEGAYAYQTGISPDLKVTWTNPTLSMTAAGMASVYVCRDLCGFNGQIFTSAGIHEAFTERPDDTAHSLLRGYRFNVRKEAFLPIQARGNTWMERNFDPVNPSMNFFYYYLYAVERYGAFKELAENKPLESPPWYNKAARVLLDKQAADGSWSGSRSDIGTGIDTAYAVLFLLRSTRQSFEKWKEPNFFDGGNLRGGRGLPTSTDDVRIEDGVVVSLSEMGNAEQLLQRLGNIQNTDEETLYRLAELPTEEVENLLKRNKTKIKLMVGHEIAAQRFAAVNLLGKSGDVSNAPALIYALTDPDPDVAEAAQKALLRLTRQLKSETLPKPEEPNFDHQMNAILKRWKDWYRTIDPDALFEER